MKMDVRNEVLSGKKRQILPQVDWKEARVRKKALPYHPTSGRESNSVVISGMACHSIRKLFGIIKVGGILPLRLSSYRD